MLSCAVYGNSADPTDSLSRYQIAMETQCHKHDVSEDSDQSDYYAEAKKLWKDVMTRHGREAKYWMEYAQMERYCNALRYQAGRGRERERERKKKRE